MPFRGELSAFLTACFWTGSAMLFASATKWAGSFQVNITRLILAAAYLALLVVLAGLDLTMSPSQILNLSLSGIVGLSLGDTFLFRAFREIGARVTMLIMSLAPAIAAGLAYCIVGETLSIAGIAGISATVLGICIVILDRRPAGTPGVTASGILYAVLAATGQGAGLVLAKMAFRESVINGFVATFVRIIASIIVLLPVAMMTKRYVHPYRMYREQAKAFWLTAAGSILGPFLGISFSLIAIEYTKVGVAATIMALVPVLMLPLVRIVYKEQLSWRAILGAFVAVGGVGVLFLR